MTDFGRPPVTFKGERIDIEGEEGFEQAPTRDARLLLDACINRPHMDFERRFAQTPLGPYKLLTHLKPYTNVLMSVAHARLGEVFTTTGLDPQRFGRYTSAIQEEVVTEYMRRFAGNTNAYESLRQEILGDVDTSSEPIVLDQHVADLIWRARTGIASMRDTAELLLRFPQMRSIEAAKYTQPLDYGAATAIQAHIYNGLEECVRDDQLDVELYDATAENRRKIHDRRINVLQSLERASDNDPEIEAYRRGLNGLMSPNQKEGKETEMAYEEARRRRAHIFAVKDNLGEVTDGRGLIQLVRKRSYIILPLHAGIDYRKEGAIQPRITRLPGMEIPVDLQTIGVSCYWRVLPVSHKS